MLFKPAWASKNEKKALKAVEKEEQPEVLCEIAKNAVVAEVRKSAVLKLNLSDALLFVAKNDSDASVREVALTRLMQIVSSYGDNCGFLNELGSFDFAPGMLIDMIKNTKYTSARNAISIKAAPYLKDENDKLEFLKIISFGKLHEEEVERFGILALEMAETIEDSKQDEAYLLIAQKECLHEKSRREAADRIKDSALKKEAFSAISQEDFATSVTPTKVEKEPEQDKKPPRKASKANSKTWRNTLILNDNAGEAPAESTDSAPPAEE
jgi:hypothetical protein